MLKVRVIPTLLYRRFGIVKGVRFDSRRSVGGAMQAVKVFDLRGVDELVFLDVAATELGRGPDLELVDDLADECFMPLTVGGGVRNADDVRRLLQVGADKVAVGTAAVERTSIVHEAAERFGSQCVVVSIDHRDRPGGGATVWSRSGTLDTGRDPVDLAGEVESLGAGEILLTCIDRDGTMAGYDLDTLSRVTRAVQIPVIAAGGAGSYRHMVEALRIGGASAVAAGSVFQFTEATPAAARHHLSDCGFPTRA